MTRFILRWAINAVAIALAVYFVPGIDLGGNLVSLVWLALIFGLVNAILRPLIKLFTFPIIILTLGLFSLVINSFLFWLTSVIGQSFGMGLSIADPIFWNSLLGGLVVSIVSTILSMIFKDTRKKRR
ncbi:MAG: phage holin family protein [Anaerolineales bacterium]|uniref:Phage holin family protein n=1 Tax=Candidatus Desulfolinea nitratireducens TaxID=2841698 RepID=A0A8J6THU3_9CHLR|nr:phage holin family protein [Candidatus Desulfolinea nitratireducens]MBL6962180.1 phage holin family protein [Anaerolineales bacterium]